MPNPLSPNENAQAQMREITTKAVRRKSRNGGGNGNGGLRWKVKRHECEENHEATGGDYEIKVFHGNNVWFVQIENAMLIKVRFCPFCGIKLE